MTRNITLLALAAFGFIASAHADFSGSYAPAQWTASNNNGGNGFVAAADASLLSLTSSDFADGIPRPVSLLDYSVHVNQDTTFSFSWQYVTDDDSSSKDTFGYAISGQAVQLSANNTGAYDDAQIGTVTVLVHGGNTFSFQMTSVDGIYGAATATVSQFSATSAVPEPEGYQLALAGLVGVVVLARRRLFTMCHPMNMGCIL
jgi:hypothetical protein